MSVELSKSMANALGLRSEDADLVRKLVDIWSTKRVRNMLRQRYYEMHRKPRDLGISVPPNLRDLEQVVGWPAKAVNALSSRSRFDGFTCDDEETGDTLSKACERNHLKRVYRQAVREELKFCCAFFAVTSDLSDPGAPKAVVSAYPATAASAIYDDAHKCIEAGMVVVATGKVNGLKGQPVWVDVYTKDYVITLKRSSGSPWNSSYTPHSMGRCLMEPMAYDATLGRPFGRSRISRAVMSLTDNAMRASLRGEVSAEFFTSPQKYLLGADPKDFTLSKWDAYIGSLFAAKGADDDTLQYGQLPQGTMQPHTEYFRNLAARFSAETCVPMSSLGVVCDNPSSAEAIYAAKEDLVIEAQDLNADNGCALRNVALMALAVERKTSFEEQMDANGVIQPKSKNPATPSLVSQSDAMVKLISAFPWLAESDVALEECGFTDDQIQRIRKDRTKSIARNSAIAILDRNRQGGVDAAESEGNGPL